MPVFYLTPSAVVPIADERCGDGYEREDLGEDSGGANDGIIDDPKRGSAEAEGAGLLLVPDENGKHTKHGSGNGQQLQEVGGAQFRHKAGG